MRGFTLVELLVYTATLSLVLILSVIFVMGVLEATAKSNAKEEVQANASAIIQLFDITVRHSQSVYDPTSDFTGDPGQLSLVSNRDLLPEEQESYVDLYIDEGKFCLKREFHGVSCASSSKTELTSLTFREITQAGGAESVQMIFTIRYKSPKQEYYFTETYQVSARVRPY
jgi:hypothetical protein